MSSDQWMNVVMIVFFALVGFAAIVLAIDGHHERARRRREAFGQYRRVAGHQARLALLSEQLSGPVEDQATRDYLRRQAQWPMASAHIFRATYLGQDVVKTPPPEDGFSVGDLPDLLQWFDQLETELAAVVQGTQLRPPLRS